MIQTAFVSLLTASLLTVTAVSPEISGSAQFKPIIEQAQSFDGVYTERSRSAQDKLALGSRSMSLNMRYGYEEPENVYKDNILLNLAYLSGSVKSKSEIDWNQLHQPKSIEFTLESGQRFAYHDVIDPKYQDSVALAVHTNFGAGDGYKYEGGLYGMGVCHLASLIHWAALDAGLESIAPSNHNFYPIPEIPKEYGVAIYNSPNSPAASMRQNLYIKNILDTKVTFKFDFDGDNLKVSIFKG